MTDEYPREPVPEAAATRPAHSITIMISSAAMGVPVMILGSSLGGNYSALTTFLVIIAGCGITALLAALAAFAGVRSRRSTALLARQAFGETGASLLNLAIAVALLGWFSVEMGFVGSMIADGLRNVFGITMGREPGIIAVSVIICVICNFGITVVSRAPMLFLPCLIILLLVVLFLVLSAPVPSGAAPLSVHTVGSGISAIVGAYIVGCLTMPDYSRFVGRPRPAMIATVLALGPVYALVLGTYAIAGQVTNASEPSGILLGLGLPAVIALVLPIGLMQNGIMCLYSSALATTTLVRSAQFRTVTIVSAIVGAGLALAGADGYFVSFLVVLGIVFPPAVALLIHSGLSTLPDHSSGTRQWAWPEIAVWCFGILCGVVSEWAGLGITGFSAFDGLLGAAAGVAMLHATSRGRIRRPS